jgi:hypothetical protein
MTNPFMPPPPEGADSTPARPAAAVFDDDERELPPSSVNVSATCSSSGRLNQQRIDP